MNNNLEVIALTKKDLREAIALNTYWDNSIEAPFSKNKALWMLNNKRSDDDDTLAILAYENSALVSFVCVVPDLIRKKEGGNVKKVFWSHRWWVSDNYKDTILSTYTKGMSLNALDNQIVIKFLGDATKAYYEKQNFTRFSERDRHIIVFSLNYDLLIYKKSSLKKIKGLLKFLDKASGKLISLINGKKSSNRTKLLSYKYVSHLDETNWNFIKEYCADDIVPKTLEYINWQLNNDQYQVSTNITDELKDNCRLGSISNSISNLNFIVNKDDKPIGFISGLVLGKRFIVRYFLSNKNNFDSCLDALIKNMIKSKCTLLQTENDVLGDRIKSRYLNLYVDTRKLFSLIHDDVGIDATNITVKDQDGNFL
ncbi:hypothetical protein [Flavivirga spongiicola]|uniref:N-acetyltransferase domain-containing protein n=1 Tax=Flavivirga spongiicola TaxID=421621 RepID=A0ABU7XYE0_9FLAO|nr:hypothetical protein [Flavivirga sp. MEBiC05379]MDO5980460.1 hypothetical protein [Flavivirga sp. MEBiC05379]